MAHRRLELLCGSRSLLSDADVLPNGTSLLHSQVNGSSRSFLKKAKRRDRVMPGDCVFGLKRYVELLKKIGHDGFLSLQLLREDLWQRDRREVARIGLE
jgi:sugar phosphate isomerase/epimerase